MTERPGEDIEPGILRTTRQPFRFLQFFPKSRLEWEIKQSTPRKNLTYGSLENPKLLFSDHERYKLEKKRERNRIAATKCRMRKMERISQLDGQVVSILDIRNQPGG